MNIIKLDFYMTKTLNIAPIISAAGKDLDYETSKCCA